jgi:hypothetical protein
MENEEEIKRCGKKKMGDKEIGRERKSGQRRWNQREGIWIWGMESVELDGN